MSSPLEAAPPGGETAARIAELEARVEGLETALARRSRELRLLQAYLCRRDLVTLSRLSTGLSALVRGTYEPSLWHETTTFTPAEVGDTLEDLWRSLRPLAEEGDDA